MSIQNKSSEHAEIIVEAISLTASTVEDMEKIYLLLAEIDRIRIHGMLTAEVRETIANIVFDKNNQNIYLDFLVMVGVLIEARGKKEEAQGYLETIHLLIKQDTYLLNSDLVTMLTTAGTYVGTNTPTKIASSKNDTIWSFMVIFCYIRVHLLDVINIIKTTK